MFTIRFKSYRIFQFYLVLMVFVSSEVMTGDSPKKCAEFNEYCLNHWDCCSNSCMSYLYRCTRGYNIYPYPFLGISYKPTVTLDQILQQNFGEPSVPSVSQPQKQQSPYFASRFGAIEENDMKDSSLELKNVLQNSQETTTSKNQEELTKIPLAFEDRLGLEHNEIKKIEVEAITEGKIITTTVEKPSCAEIGAKCYTHNECCSKLCHGYLHQCVT